MNMSGKLESEKRNKMPTPFIKEENVPVDVIDLDEYKTLEEVSIEWNIRVLNYFKYFFCEDTERSLSSVMRWYIQTLKEDAVDQLDDKIMKHAMEKHILYCKLYFKEIDCSFYDNYLDNMEEILAIYCDLKVRTLPKKQGKDPTTFKNELITIFRKLILLLRIYLFGHDHCVLHVLMRMKLYTDTEEARDFFNLMFGYFMDRKPTNKSDLSFCRIYILCQKWKKIRPSSEWTKMDDQMYGLYGRTSDSLKNNNILRRILLPQHESVLDILAHINNNYQVLMQQYFEFLHSTDATDLEEMDALKVGIENRDFIEQDFEDEDENFQTAFNQYVRSLDDVKLEIIGETIVLSDDEDDEDSRAKPSSKNEVKDENESDDEIEFFVTNNCDFLEISDSDDDEICFEPVVPAMEQQSNSHQKKSSNVSTSTTTMTETNATTLSPTIQPIKLYAHQPHSPPPNDIINSRPPIVSQAAPKVAAVTIATQTDEDLEGPQQQQQRHNNSIEDNTAVNSMICSISGSSETKIRLNNNKNDDKVTQKCVNLCNVVTSVSDNNNSDVEMNDVTDGSGEKLVVDTSENTTNIVTNNDAASNSKVTNNVDTGENLEEQTSKTQTTSINDENSLPIDSNDNVKTINTSKNIISSNNKNDDIEINDPSSKESAAITSTTNATEIMSSSLLQADVDDDNDDEEQTNRSDKIMYTSPMKIDRILHRDFCQFEEFVNKSKNVFDEILSGPLVERIGSLTCPPLPSHVLPVDNSLDIFDNSSSSNNNNNLISNEPLLRSSPVDRNVNVTPCSNEFVSPVYEEGLVDFTLDEAAAAVAASVVISSTNTTTTATCSSSNELVKDDENMDPNGTTNESPSASIPTLSKHAQTPITTTTPMLARKPKVLVFGENEYDDDNQRKRTVRPPMMNGSNRQLKSILRTRKELYISVKKLTPAELNQWERVSELSRRVREMKMMKAGLSGQEVVKKLYLEKFKTGNETGSRKITIPFAPWRPPDENNSKKLYGKGADYVNNSLHSMLDKYEKRKRENGNFDVGDVSPLKKKRGRPKIGK